MEIKISIIVPIFNTERFIVKCIRSILNQTLVDFELILVNDGSTDKSGEICDEFAKKDQRIRVIHKRNGGVSSARNVGLNIARGKYIGFVDSDDYVKKDMYEILYNAITLNVADIVVCDFWELDEVGGQRLNTIENIYKVQKLNNIESLNQMYLNKSMYIRNVVPWNKLYKRNLFDNIQYEIGNIYDDETVVHKLFYNSKKVIYTNLKLYYYVQRSGSQMNSEFHIKRFDKIYALKDREEYFRKKQEYNIHQKALKHYMEMFFWYYYLAKSKLNNIDKELIELKFTFDSTLVYLLKHKEINLKQKMMLLLFRINPRLYEFLRDFKVN